MNFLVFLPSVKSLSVSWFRSWLSRMLCLGTGNRWAAGRTVRSRLPGSCSLLKQSYNSHESVVGLVRSSLAIPKSESGVLFLPCSEKPLVVLYLLKGIGVWMISPSADSRMFCSLGLSTLKLQRLDLILRMSWVHRWEGFLKQQGILMTGLYAVCQWVV